MMSLSLKAYKLMMKKWKKIWNVLIIITIKPYKKNDLIDEVWAKKNKVYEKVYVFFQNWVAP